MRLSAAERTVLDLVHPNGPTVPPLTGAEWDRVVALAVREQVAPLVLAGLRQGCGGEVPASVLIALETISLRTSAHAAAAYEQLTAVLRRLRAAGTAVALIKGAALARFAYADSTLRPFNDLDLLVSRHELVAVDRALREAGYATAPAGAHGRRDAGERVYWDPAWRRVPIDVHWRFDADPLSLGIDYEAVLRRARAEVIDTAPVLVLSPADTLVALSAHFVKHLWGSQPRLRYLRDIAEIVRGSRVDWDVLAETTMKAPMASSPLRLTLSAAARLTGARVPGGVLAALAASRGARADRWICDVVCGRILRRDAPVAALIQVAVMRWLDRDIWDTYPRLTAAVVRVQS